MKVNPWPRDQAWALRDLASTPGIAVIRVDMPDHPAREIARQRIRVALRETIAAWLKVTADHVSLRSGPGQAVALDAPAPGIGISVSHEEGVSVAALHRYGSVGIDLVRVTQTPLPDWEQVAHDYLGPIALQRMTQQPTAQRAAAFAQAWSQHEARLKCLGIALPEWTPVLEISLAACTAIPLKLDENFRGTLALRKLH